MSDLEVVEFTDDEIKEQQKKQAKGEANSRKTRLLAAAPMIEKVLSEKPEATVNEIAGATGAGSVTVAETLNEVQVLDDGKFKFVGAGKGGNWYPARMAAQEEEARQAEIKKSLAED